MTGARAPEPPGAWERVCVEPGSWFLSDIMPSEPYDYVWLNIDGFLIEERGTPCATARDSNACSKALDAVKRRVAQDPSQSLPADGLRLPIVVTTSGDAVQTYEQYHGILQFLGLVDTAGEATLTLWVSGHPLPHCTSAGAEKVSMRRVDGGYEFETLYPQCPDSTQLDKVLDSGSVVRLRESQSCSIPGRQPR